MVVRQTSSGVFEVYDIANNITADVADNAARLRRVISEGGGSEATVIFWTADLRVTASARIVLVMIRAPRHWSWQGPTRRWVAPRRVGRISAIARQQFCVPNQAASVALVSWSRRPPRATWRRPGQVPGPLLARRVGAHRHSRA
jgi:hypothetical protein